MISNPIAVGALLAAVAWASVRLEERFSLVRSLGSALVAILVAMALSNVGLIPGNSPAYDFLFGPGVMAGIALIMLSVHLRSVIRAGPTMLAAFGIGAVGSVVGAIVAALVFGGVPWRRRRTWVDRPPPWPWRARAAMPTGCCRALPWACSAMRSGPTWEYAVGILLGAWIGG